MKPPNPTSAIDVELLAEAPSALVRGETKFDQDVLLIFIGHSEDAKAEAETIRGLELILQRHLEDLRGVSRDAVPVRTIRFWEWTYDALPAVGGQARTITPELDRADIAIFVFKERIGTETWAELERRRSQAKPLIVLFPSNPPPPERLQDEAGAENWFTLLRKKRELTANWSAPDSDSVTPLEDYRDITHLATIATHKLKDSITAVLRKRPETRPAASVEEPRRFLGDRPDLQFDQRPVLSAPISQLNQESLNTCFAQPLAQDWGVPDKATSLMERTQAAGLLTDGRPTVGAFLCFAPARLFGANLEACSLQKVIYEGASRASRVGMYTKRGNLIELFEDGISWLSKDAGLRRMGVVGGHSRDELEIPVRVLREALANALIHRDYETPALQNQPTRIEVYSDRVEITSFGPLPSSISVNHLNSEEGAPTPIRRNPIIARVFQWMALAELNASGVLRMRSGMEEASLPSPLFTESKVEDFVRVVLKRPSLSNDKRLIGAGSVTAEDSPEPFRTTTVGSKPVAFLSCSNREADRALVDAVVWMLSYSYDVKKYDLEGSASGPVSQFLRLASQSSLIVCLFTKQGRDVSPWLMAEAGMLWGLGKKDSTLVLVDEGIPPQTWNVLQDAGYGVHAFSGPSDLAEKLSTLIKEVNHPLALPSGNIAVIKSEVVCTIDTDGHSIVTYDHAVRVRTTAFDPSRDIKIRLGLGVSSPQFSQGVLPVEQLLANDPRDHTKQSFRYRIVRPTEPGHYRIVEVGQQDRPDWKYRDLCLVLPRKLTVDEELQYAYAWSCPEGFSKEGPEYFVHRPAHGVSRLTITLRFKLPQGGNLPDPWAERFIRTPELVVRDGAKVPTHTRAAVTTLEHREYHWHFQDVRPGEEIRIEWELSPVETAPKKPVRKRPMRKSAKKSTK